jgi:hypothetical protein
VFGGGGRALSYYFRQFVDHTGFAVGECFDDQPPGSIVEQEDYGLEREWRRSGGIPSLFTDGGAHVAGSV